MKTALKVALIAWLWMVAVNPGDISVDTAARLEMAHALWTGTEEISLPADYQPSRRGDAGVVGVGGKRYYIYDLGQPLLMIPGDWLGTQLHQRFPQWTRGFWSGLTINFLIFIPLNVAAVVACFWLLKLFDFSNKIAGLASLTWLLATTVLHYAQINQQNNQILLFVTLGYATALAYLRSRKSSFVVLSGFCLGTAFLIRMTTIIHGGMVLLFLIGCLLYQTRGKLLEISKFIWLWIVGFLPCTVLWGWFNYCRFGSFLTTGDSLWVQQVNVDPIYSNLPQLPPNYPLINSPQFGIWGVLLSPAKSIFIYDPLLLPCLVLGIFYWRRLSPYIQWYLITALFNLGLHIILTSQLDFWHGDAAWGARYHVTSVHLLLIPLIALFIQQLVSSRGRFRQFLTGILALAIAVQIASVILHPTADTGRIYFANPSSFLTFRLGRRITNIGCLINPSFSQQCPQPPSPTNENPLLHKVALLPFNFTQSREIILVVWGLLVMAAIASTIWFCRTI